jgi:tetratricopeptide (TPR) repeat protein/TolB-like protein
VPSPGDVQPQEVATALTRLLDSEPFRRSPRAREFLAYVCAETLAGRASGLYERVVARRAMHKGPRFDGRTDASVRVQAHRVRAALRSYYLDEGRTDDIVVSLPAGTYVPEFSRSCATELAASSPQPAMSVAVVRVVHTHADVDGLATLLACRLARRLTEIPGLNVVGPSHQSKPDAALVAHRLGTRFVLECSVVEDEVGQVVALTLSDGVSGRLLWSDSGPLAGSANGSLADLDEWAVAAAAQLGDYAGLMVRHVLRETASAHAGEEMAARLAFYEHIIRGGPDTLRHARTVLDAAAAEGTSADVIAMHAFVLATEVYYGLSTERDADLEIAISKAREALREEPRSALAYIALAVVAAARGDVPRCRAHALHAVDLAPQHPSTLFSAGGLLAGTGDWTRGSALMRRSFALNPLHPAYQHANLAIERLLDDDLPGALAEASIVDEGGLGWGPLCRALALAGLGHVEQAEREMSDALDHFPGLLTDSEVAFADLALDGEQRSSLERLLEPFREPAA